MRKKQIIAGFALGGTLLLAGVTSSLLADGATESTQADLRHFVLGVSGMT